MIIMMKKVLIYLFTGFTGSDIIICISDFIRAFVAILQKYSLNEAIPSEKA